jgi:hypothetical protein
VALLKIHIIDVAPAPAFASFGGLDDGVLCRVEVRASVAVFRGVAATYVTALHAHAEMHPGVAGLQAVFAAFAAGFYLLYVIFDVRTGWLCHSFLLICRTSQLCAARRGFVEPSPVERFEDVFAGVVAELAGAEWRVG